MSKISRFNSFFLLSAVIVLTQQNAFAFQPDESDLDSLIPQSTRDRIDQRKSESRHARAAVLGSFAGSREVDLRSHDTSIKQQFSAKKCAGVFHTKVGTCSTFGLAAAVENAMGGTVNLSERHLWSQYCVPSSSDAIDAISQGSGVVEESAWPQNYVSAPSGYSKGTHYKLFEFHALEDNVPAMLEALDRGSPLYFAVNTPSEMYSRNPVINADSGNTGGGHAIAIVGYKLDETVEGGGYLLVKNSWGTSKSFTGYQWLSIGYCARKGNYCSAWSIDRAGKN